MSIILNNLKAVKTTGDSQNGSTYVDLRLDMGFNNKDLNVSLDESAIKNALIVLLNSYPGEHILNPTMGIDLQKELFEQISEEHGYTLAGKIRSAIADWEPRVKVEQINVGVLIDQQMYQIEVIIRIPALKFKTKLTGIFKDRTFTQVTE